MRAPGTSVRSAQGCPRLDTAGSGWLQPIHAGYGWALQPKRLWHLGKEDLRKGNKCCTVAVWERSENKWGEQPCRHPGQCRRIRSCSRHWSWDCPAAPGEDHGEAARPLQPLEDHREEEFHVMANGGLHARAGGCILEKAETAWSHTRAWKKQEGKRVTHWSC